MLVAHRRRRSVHLPVRPRGLVRAPELRRSCSPGRARGLALAAALVVASATSAARAVPPAAPTPVAAPVPPVAPPAPVVAPAAPPPAPPPVVVVAPEPPPAVAPAPEPLAEVPEVHARAVGPVPTGDATPAPSDHDAVVGHVGLEVRRIDASPFGLDLGPNGCPSSQPQPCSVNLGALSVRYWESRNLALTGGLALGFGGGKDAGSGLDSYAGVGPIVGLSLLLGNWRHLAVSASPEASWIWFKPGGDGATTKVITLRAALEGELHFGFVGVPALSIGMVAGLGFRYVGVGDERVWAVGVVGPGSVADVLSDLFIRYYL
jgi:hypothetical protein